MIYVKQGTVAPRGSRVFTPRLISANVFVSCFALEIRQNSAALRSATANFEAYPLQPPSQSVGKKETRSDRKNLLHEDNNVTEHTQRSSAEAVGQRQKMEW